MKKINKSFCKHIREDDYVIYVARIFLMEDQIDPDSYVLRECFYQ